MVAENSSVRRVSGVPSSNSSRSSRKPMSSISSASSSTTARKRSQVERAAFEMVAQAARGADHDLRPVAQRAAFLRRVHPAHAGRHAQARLAVEPDEFAADLQREFARGRDDQRQRAFGGFGHAGGPEQRVGHGQPEGDGLARSGLGGDHEVPLLGVGGDDRGLDRGGLIVAARAQRIGERRGETGIRHGAP